MSEFMGKDYAKTTIVSELRDKMECKALAVEFGGGSEVARDCRAFLPTLAEIARESLAIIDRRDAKPDMVACRAR